jgi:hypothetical protein
MTLLDNVGEVPCGGHLMPNSRVVPGDAALELWRLKICGFLKEFSCLAENQEAMRETPRHPNLFVVLPGKYFAHARAECGGCLPNINRNIKYLALCYPHQLALWLLNLVMQSGAIPPWQIVSDCLVQSGVRVDQALAQTHAG